MCREGVRQMANAMSAKIRFMNYKKLEMVNPDTLKLWNRYKIDMTLRELSPKTIAAYENDFQHFMIYILDNFENKSVVEIDEDEITQFLYFCKTEGNNSRRIKRRMSSISAFYKYLRKKRIIDENPMEFIDRPKKDVDIVTQTFLTEDQVNLMRARLREHGDLDLHLYAMFSLSTMARVNAVSSVRWEQIDFENRVVNEVLEKEGKVVVLYFSDEVKDLLLRVKAQREEKGIDDNGWVFYSRLDKSDGSVSNSTLHQWCKKIGQLIGVPSLHCHDFRHSGATLLKNRGMSLEDVSSLLNHAGTDVTKKFYIREDKTKIQMEKDKYEI